MPLSTKFNPLCFHIMTQCAMIGLKWINVVSIPSAISNQFRVENVATTSHKNNHTRARSLSTILSHFKRFLNKHTSLEWVCFSVIIIIFVHLFCGSCFLCTIVDALRHVTSISAVAATMVMHSPQLITLKPQPQQKYWQRAHKRDAIIQ